MRRQSGCRLVYLWGNIYYISTQRYQQHFAQTLNHLYILILVERHDAGAVLQLQIAPYQNKGSSIN